MLFYIIFGLTYGFAAAVQPGPLQTYFISQALKIGWRRTLPATFAPLITDLPIAVLVILLLSRMPIWLEQVLHLCGGVFVLYLAFGTFMVYKSFDVNKTVEVQSSQTTVLKAVVVNFLSPGPYLGWSLVLGPLMIKGWREAPTNGIALVVTFYGILIITSMAIIVLFSAAKSLGPRIDRIMILLSAIALACFGFYQLWLGVITL
jgi:threonine/homoserine/homoserine lactone efflux protein